MIECPTCLELVEPYEMTIDQDMGKCCYLCSEHFQFDRDLYFDNMRKAWKSGEITDDEYQDFCESFGCD